jgi:hypothetical protein
MAKRVYAKRQAAKVKGYRSGLEEDLDASLKRVGVDGQYEQHKIKYVKPETQHTYTPDFKLPNGIFIETKGRFVAEDRKKHILIKSQHPELDIRFVFQNSKNKLRKGSKTTYADWCNKYGFLYADKDIPAEWFA